MSCINPDNAVWSFETDRFFIGLFIEPEDMDPADSFEFPKDIEAVRNGDVEWFCAFVRVFVKGDNDRWTGGWREIGSDHLGGCAYHTIREFYTGHRDHDPMNRNSSVMRAEKGANVCIVHYFPDMVRQAIADARATVARLNVKAA